MDHFLEGVQSHLKLCRLLLEARLSKIENSKTKLSRDYNRMKHTRAMVGLIEELEGVVTQDPDNWDEEPESVPF